MFHIYAISSVHLYTTFYVLWGVKKNGHFTGMIFRVVNRNVFGEETEKQVFLHVPRVPYNQIIIEKVLISFIVEESNFFFLGGGGVGVSMNRI